MCPLIGVQDPHVCFECVESCSNEFPSAVCGNGGVGYRISGMCPLLAMNVIKPFPRQ